MSNNSRKKRKIYGAVRDLDENFLKHSEKSDNEKDIDSCIESGSNGGDDSDFHSSGGIDFDGEKYYNVDHVIEHQRKGKETSVDRDAKKSKVQTCKVDIKKKEDIKYSKIKTKKEKNQSLAVDSTREGNVTNVAIKVESDDGENGKRTRERKKMTDSDSFDVVLSSSILNGGGGCSDNQCTLLVEVSNLRDAIALGEFGGSIGAIGRFESDPNGITLDLKGNQYRGSLLPGPSCLIAGLSQPFGMKKRDLTTGTDDKDVQEEADEAGKLRVEGIADEYATLVQIDDHMKKLDAVVTENENNRSNDQRASS